MHHLFTAAFIFRSMGNAAQINSYNVTSENRGYTVWIRSKDSGYINTQHVVPGFCMYIHTLLSEAYYTVMYALVIMWELISPPPSITPPSHIHTSIPCCCCHCSCVCLTLDDHKRISEQVVLHPPHSVAWRRWVARAEGTADSAYVEHKRKMCMLMIVRKLFHRHLNPCAKQRNIGEIDKMCTGAT